MREPASLGSLSSGVFERRTSTGSELFSLLIRLHATKFVLLSVFTLIETIWPIICSKSLPRSAKSQLPVDVRRSKTSLLKLPILAGKRDSHRHSSTGLSVVKEQVTKS